MSIRTNVIVLTLASRTAGVVSRAELVAAGVAPTTIAGRVRQGFLVSVWKGVYEVPELTTDLTPLFRAVKAAPGSALSHRTAARVGQFPISGDGSWELVHITTPFGGPRTEMPGVVRHRTRRPFAEDMGYPIAGLPVLSPARTVLDLAGDASISDRRLRYLVENRIAADRLDVTELQALLERPGLRGVGGAKRYRALVEALSDGEPVVESMLERRFERLLADHGIGGFRRQVVPPWYDGRRGIVDFANASVALIVEVDGRRWHATGQAMTEDRRRDRTAAAHGWQVLRVTWTDLVDEPTRTAQQLQEAVSARSRLNLVEPATAPVKPTVPVGAHFSYLTGTEG